MPVAIRIGDGDVSLTVLLLLIETSLDDKRDENKVRPRSSPELVFTSTATSLNSMAEVFASAITAIGS